MNIYSSYIIILLSIFQHIIILLSIFQHYVIVIQIYYLAYLIIIYINYTSIHIIQYFHSCVDVCFHRMLWSVIVLQSMFRSIFYSLMFRSIIYSLMFSFGFTLLIQCLISCSAFCRNSNKVAIQFNNTAANLQTCYIHNIFNL